MKAIRRYGWLLISGFVFLGMASASLVDHFRSIEGPADLVAVSGRFISGKCETFHGITTSKGGSGALLANPAVRYTYVINGKSYEGTRYARSRTYAMGNPTECERYLALVQGQPQVVVWVDPDHPDFSVLYKDTGTPFLEYVFISVGLALVASGGYCIFRRRLDEA